MANLPNYFVAIENQKFPLDGSKGLYHEFDFAADGPSQVFDLTALMARDRIENIQSIKFNNRGNADVTLRVGGTNEEVLFPADTAGTLSIVSKGAFVGTFTSAGAGKLRAFLLNVPFSQIVYPSAVAAGGGGGGGGGGGTQDVSDADTHAALNGMEVTLQAIDTALGLNQYDGGDLRTYDARAVAKLTALVNELAAGLNVNDQIVQANTQATSNKLDTLATILDRLDAIGADTAAARADLDKLQFASNRLLVDAGGTGGGGGGGGSVPASDVNIASPLDNGGNVKVADAATLAAVKSLTDYLGKFKFDANGNLQVTSGGGGGGGNVVITGPVLPDGSVSVGDATARTSLAAMISKFYNFVTFDVAQSGAGYVLNVIARNWRRLTPDAGGFRASTDQPAVKVLKNAQPNTRDLGDAGGPMSFMEPIGSFAFVDNYGPAGQHRIVDANCPLGGYYYIDCERLGLNTVPNWNSPTYWYFIRRLAASFDGAIHAALQNDNYFRMSLIFVRPYNNNAQPPKYYELATIQYNPFVDAASAKTTIGLAEMLFSTPDCTIGPVQEVGKTYRGFFALATNAEITQGRMRLNVLHHLMDGITAQPT